MKSLYERQLKAIDESIAYNRRKKQGLLDEIKKVEQTIVNWENRKKEIKNEFNVTTN